MPYIGTCFRFYTQMRVQKNPKHLHIEFIVTSHNSVGKFLLSLHEKRNFMKINLLHIVFATYLAVFHRDTLHSFPRVKLF